MFPSYITLAMHKLCLTSHQTTHQLLKADSMAVAVTAESTKTWFFMCPWNSTSSLTKIIQDQTRSYVFYGFYCITDSFSFVHWSNQCWFPCRF